MNPEPLENDTPSHELFSPEGVHLDLPVAGPAPRMFAYAIDFAVIALLIVFLMIALFSALPISAWLDRLFSTAFHQAARAAKRGNPSNSSGSAAGLLIAIFLVAQFVVETGYFIFWEMVTNGRSPGKALIGLRVVCRNGLPINLRSSAVRNFMRIVDILPASYVVGLISIIVSASCERLGDHAAGTLVVRLDRPEAASELPVGADMNQVPLTRQQLARIGPRELQLVRGTLRRVANLPEDRSAQLVAEVVETLRTRMELDALPSPDRIAFLRSVLTMAERYSRSASR
jgi:uncharacterized RDD family membrane protein YckC